MPFSAAIPSVFIHLQYVKNMRYMRNSQYFIRNKYFKLENMKDFLIVASNVLSKGSMMITILTESQQHTCQRDCWCRLPMLAQVHQATPSYPEYVCSQPAMSHWKENYQQIWISHFRLKNQCNLFHLKLSEGHPSNSRLGSAGDYAS